MRVLGLDIGTTTLSASLWEDGREAEWRTVANDSTLPPDCPGAHIQSPERIEALARELIGAFPRPDGVALTGQMHGILYADRTDRAVSPLYTWQDQRSAPLIEELTRTTGRPMAAGYGLATHAALMRTNQVPRDAARMMTVMDYLALRLCGECAMHASDAASLGAFDVEAGRFDGKALDILEVDGGMLPPVRRTAGVLGATPEGVRVFTAIGDNQASFFGAAGGEGVLLNLGTGGQISVYSSAYRACPPCETRPLDGESCLLTGSLLCGGRAYALLEGFFRQCAELAGAEAVSLYEVMNRLALEEDNDPVTFEPLFCGSREDPAVRGRIAGLGEGNFTPGHLIRGLLRGLADEMYRYYEPLSLGAPEKLYGSGNAIRKNPALQRILEKRFGAKLTFSPAREEAAFGAARLAANIMRKEKSHD